MLEPETAWEVNLAVRLTDTVVALSVVPSVRLSCSIGSRVAVAVVLL